MVLKPELSAYIPAFSKPRILGCKSELFLQTFFSCVLKLSQNAATYLLARKPGGKSVLTTTSQETEFFCCHRA